MAFEKIGLKYVVEGADAGIRDLDKLEKAERDVAKGASDVSEKTGGMGKTIAGTAVGFAAAELGLKALKGAFQFAIGNAVSFEKQMDQVGAIAQATEPEMAALSATAKQLGADTAFSAGEAALAMEELAAGGRSVAQILGGEAKAAVDLAAAGNYGLADSARTIATTMDIWKGSTIDTTDVVNRLAGAANTSRFGVDDMSAAIAQGGGVAATAGVSFQDFSTVIAATASSFASGSDAGTSFKTFVVSLSGSSEKAKDMIKELGLEFYNAQGQLKPMSEIVQELNGKLSKLTPEMQTVALKTIFGNDAFRTAAGLMKITGDEFTAMSNKMRDTDASVVAAQRMGNLSGKMEELKGSAETLGISIGSKAIPVLTDLASGATTAVNAFSRLPESTQGILLLGTTAAVTAPKLIAMATALSGLSAASLGVAGPIGVAVAALLALDFATKEFTGDTLFTILMGKEGDAERAEKAMKNWNEMLTAAGPNADKAKVAFTGLGSLMREIETTGASLDTSVGILEAATDVVLKPWEPSESKARADMAKEFAAQVRFLGEQMAAGGASATELWTAYQMLPGPLKEVFAETTNVVGVYQASQDRIEATNFAIRAQTEAHAGQLEILPKVKTALDVFNEGIAEEEAATGKAVDRTKELSAALDVLAGRFAATNPEIISAQGKLAAVDEELADLKRSGGEWSETLGMTRAELTELKKSLEDQIATAGENEKATKGMRDELKLYIDDGLINLQAALRDSELSLEEQVNAEIKVGEALRALSNNDVPGFIKAMKVVEEQVPGIAKTVYNEMGPELKAKIDGAQGLMREAGLGLATSLAQGVIAGLNGASTDVGDASATLMRQVTEAMALKAQIESPSKVTEYQGRMIAEGLILGIRNGGEGIPAAVQGLVGEIEENMDSRIIAWINGLGDDVRLQFKSVFETIPWDEYGQVLYEDMSVGVWKPAYKAIDDGAMIAANKAADAATSIIQTMKDNIASGTELDRTGLGDLLQSMSDLIMNNRMPDAARKLAEQTITGWAISIGAGEQLANQSVIEFMEKLRNTILKEAAALPAYKTGEDLGGKLAAGLRSKLPDLRQGTQDVMRSIAETWEVEALGFGQDMENDLVMWKRVLEKGWQENRSMSVEEITAMFSHIAAIINDSPLAGAYGQMMDHAQAALYAEWQETGSLSNTAMMKWFDDMISIADSRRAELEAAMVIPGMSGAPSQFILGSDGKWYPSEKDMPPGVTGASSGGDPNARTKDGTVTSYIGGGQNAPLPTGEVPIGTYIPGLGYKTRNGWEQTQGAAADVDAAYRSGQYQQGFVGGVASPTTAQAVVGASGGSPTPSQTTISFDFSGANLTGTPEENEVMMTRVVNQVLSDQLGREAYISGV